MYAFRGGAGSLGVPGHIGRMKNMDSFDNTFFGVAGKLSDALDPVGRLFLQLSYEAVVDAGGFYSSPGTLRRSGLH